MSSLYNTHRPTDFPNVIGQDHICKVLAEQISSNNLHHSIILYGPSGCGKTTVARILANSITSTKDIIEKDSATAGKVENIRSLQNEIVHAPWEGEYKVYIFDEAQGCSKAGFDSLLKTIEEPPSHIKFIFVTTNFNALPLTIRSRSQCYSFNYVTNELLAGLVKKTADLEDVDLTPDLIKLIVSAASGSPRRALVVLESVMSTLSHGASFDEIFATLGLISSQSFTNFIAYHIFGQFENLHKSSSMFSDQHVELDRALSDLQQFIVDTRIGLIYPANIPNLRSDVVELVSLIEEQQLKSGMDKQQYRGYVNSRLDSMRFLSNDLSKNLYHAYNKSALLTGFVVDLALSWKQQ